MNGLHAVRRLAAGVAVMVALALISSFQGCRAARPPLESAA